MTIGEQLREKQKQQNKGKKKREEKVDWADIMNTNMPTYRRGKGGAIRRK